MLKLLARILDAVTSAGFAAAAACVAIITFSFAYEVVARYFFGAPTSWAYDLSSYALCPMIFLAIPEMTRRQMHIAVSYLVEALPDVKRARATLAVTIVAAIICFIAAYITGAETWRQFVTGTQTISASPISKWWVSIFIPYGLLGAALHFMWHAFAGDIPPATQGALQ
jgi:TRAP-type C4-dicarboxylate transport system permease small subunit